MSRLGPRAAAAGGAAAAAAAAVTAVACLPSPASAAGGGFQKCLDQAASHGGEPPVCTRVNGEWVASWPDDGGSSGGAGMIVVLLVLGVVIAIAVGIWRVSTAQRLAKDAGLDPRLATRMALLSDDGLEATYLASSLRQPPVGEVPSGAAAPVSRSVGERLTELASLRDQGMVTDAEYDAQRRAIIGEV